MSIGFGDVKPPNLCISIGLASGSYNNVSTAVLHCDARGTEHVHCVSVCVGVCVQCLWRCHAAEQKSKFHATWRIHEQDSMSSGHHSSHHIAKSLSRLARRTTGSISSTSRKPWHRQVSRSSLMDASHVAVAGSVELSGHPGAAGDTFDADDHTSPFASAAGGFVIVTFVTGRSLP